MQYFTAELYQQFNSLDENEAELADELWDKAEIAYKKRLTSIRKQMPPEVVKLSKLNLHDALVVLRNGEFPAALILAADGDEVVSLLYHLSDAATTKKAPKGWRLSKVQEQWLYDEVDRINEEGGSFVHRILFSTGITMEIPFVKVAIHKFKMPVNSKMAKQIA